MEKYDYLLTDEQKRSVIKSLLKRGDIEKSIPKRIIWEDDYF
jgi:hypothetical protein